jgi:hypothetical protein
MPVKEEITSVMTYRLHENNIHELIYTDASRVAVDAFWAYLDRFIEEGKPEDLYCILNDLRQSGHQPLSYYFSRLRQFNAQHPADKRPQARFALLYRSSSPLIGTVDTFIRMLNPRRVRIRIFPNNQYDEAVAWLLEEMRRHQSS